MGVVVMARGVRCRLGWHTWVKRRNDQGISFSVCARCGKEDFTEPVPPGVTLG